MLKDRVYDQNMFFCNMNCGRQSNEFRRLYTATARSRMSSKHSPMSIFRFLTRTWTSSRIRSKHMAMMPIPSSRYTNLMTSFIGWSVAASVTLPTGTKFSMPILHKLVTQKNVLSKYDQSSSVTNVTVPVATYAANTHRQAVDGTITLDFWGNCWLYGSPPALLSILHWYTHVYSHRKLWANTWCKHRWYKRQNNKIVSILRPRL